MLKMIVFFALIFLIINCADEVFGAPQYYPGQAQYHSIQNGVPNAHLTSDHLGARLGATGNMFYLLCSDCEVGGRKKK